MDVASTSTPLRKSKKKGANKKALVELTPEDTIQEDEAERKKRRSMADMQKRLSSVPAPGSPGLNSSTNTCVDIEEIKEHFKFCQRLFTQNKINSKNAWNLKLIDYLKVLVSQNMFGKDTMLIAATSLDICTKVYACRVDDVYEKGLKLAGTIASLERKTVEDDEDDNGNAEESEGGNQPPKKKKKFKRLSMGQKHTIVKDPNVLQLPETIRMCSTFFTGRIDVEASKTEILFTNKIPLDPVGYKMLLLDTKSRGMKFYDEEDPSVEHDKLLRLELKVNQIKICQPFSEFSIDEWDPDQEDLQIAEFNRNQEKRAPVVNDELVYDEDGIPIAELDGSIHDIFADDNAVDDEENQDVEFITSMWSINKGNLNAELDPWWMKRVWVGPSHWKNKFLKQRLSRFTGKVVNQAPLKSKKKIKVVSAGIDFEDYQPVDFTKKFKFMRKAKCNTEKCTLPPNYLVNAPDSRMLCLKPLIPKKEYQAKPKDDEYEHSPYDYNNPNDSQYCSQHNVLDEVHDNNEPLPENNDATRQEEHVANCVRAPENMAVVSNARPNLIKGPEVVQPMYIPYALRAKKINMRRLKHTTWDILTEDKNTVINIEMNPNKKMNLSNLYTKLPSRLPDSMCKELSLPLAFVALLHLTNEFNLKLTGRKDLRDVRIEQDSNRSRDLQMDHSEYVLSSAMKD